MFLDEARLSLRMNHANVVQTYEVLAGDRQLAIAMEYLDGQPLNRVLNRLLRGSERAEPAVAAPDHDPRARRPRVRPHADRSRRKPLEVVHRDVSPQNVFVTYDGQVKLVDFGVAKTLAASHHTRPGTIKGSSRTWRPSSCTSRPSIGAPICSRWA
jgi:serine/threonine-protein kinase